MSATETPHRAVVARRLQRQRGVSRRALSPVGRERFDMYVDVCSRLEALDRHMQGRSLAEAEGEAHLWLAYGPLSQAARDALDRLVEHFGEEERRAAG